MRVDGVAELIDGTSGDAGREEQGQSGNLESMSQQIYFVRPLAILSLPLQLLR